MAAVALGLAGCGGGGATGPTFDMTGVAGDGTSSLPYVMPAAVQAGQYDMYDYLAQGGFWRLPTDTAAIFDSTTTKTAIFDVGSLLYDSANDEWSVTAIVNGSSVTSTLVAVNANGSIDHYLNGGQAIDLFIYSGDQSAMRYGAFGQLRLSDNFQKIHSYAYFYTGLKTVSMPTAGTARYDGNYDMSFIPVGGSLTGAWISQGSVALTVDFATSGVSLTGSSLYGNVSSFSGSGTITPYSAGFSGTVTGTIYDYSGALTTLDSGVFNGAFYGPAADETAGVVDFGNAAGDRMIGGFWAGQTSYTP